MILLNQNYDCMVDMWSAGCIYAEMVSKLDQKNSMKGVLFPGVSCYPMSPLGGENDE